MRTKRNFFNSIKLLPQYRLYRQMFGSYDRAIVELAEHHRVDESVIVKRFIAEEDKEERALK